MRLLAAANRLKHKYTNFHFTVCRIDGRTQDVKEYDIFDKFDVGKSQIGYLPTHFHIGKRNWICAPKNK